MIGLARATIIGFVLFCAIAAGLVSTNLLRGADWAIYDMQMRWLRSRAPSELAQDVVVIGLDEAAYEAIAEPYSLWHRHLGALFTGLAQARPAVVGVAVPLPVRSYDFLVKGIDAPLLDGVRRLRAVAPLVVGQPIGVGRKLRPIAPELLVVAGIGTIASLVICEDSDGTVRRLNQRRCVDEDRNPPFAHLMANALGREGSASGMIDYSAGGDIEYIPVMTVLDWIRQGHQAQLEALVQGRAVVVASLLPTEIRYRLPVQLAAWERASRSEPAAVVHVQALRSMLGRGMVEPVTVTVTWLLAALATLMWFGRNGRFKLLVLATSATLALAGSAMALWHGFYVHTGTLLAVGVLAFLARLGWESVLHYRERQLLRTAFAGHVSSQVMRAILGGRLQPDGDGVRSKVTILLADIRGFTMRSDKSTPQAMIALLNRYYAEVSAAIQGRGGAIDKFLGDGLMATFGVPVPLPSPERNALEAAQGILVRLARLNGELKAEGLAPLEIGIGIHAGQVLAGYVGSLRRRDFTVIGDPVEMASRLEGMSRTLGYPVVCSNEIAAAVGFKGGLVDLGVQPIMGQADVHAWGWNPPLVERLGKGLR